MTDTLTRHAYAPRGACAQVFESRDPEVLLSGPAGTGKSRACLEKLHLMMLLNPGAKGLIVRQTLASLGSTALDTYRKFVAVEALTGGQVAFYGGSAQEPPQYRYENGSAIYIGGMDKPSKIMSSEYDVIYVQEATELTVDGWEALATRLRNGKVSFQQLLADCNPDRPTHWLKQRAQAGQTTIMYGHHQDNPRLWDDQAGEWTAPGVAYMDRLRALTGVRRHRLLDGLWVAAEGVIFDTYDPSINLVPKPHDPPADWVRYWTVDFGFTHPFVLQCWAVDPDGRAFRYREIFHTQRLVEDHARTILKCVTRADGTWTEPKPRAIICDHDAEDRATLERHLKMSTTPAKKTVSDGLQAVQARWRPSGDGRPRLFYVTGSLVERDPALTEAGRPTCSEEEIGGYVWNASKDAPVKEMDDGMDCTRYLVAHLDIRSKTRMRWAQ